MSDLLLGESSRKLILTIAIIIAILVTIYLFAKFKPVQALISLIVFVALIFSAVISTGHINAYYSNKGGIFGSITSIKKKNQVAVKIENEDIYFDFQNVVLTKNSKGKYCASMTSNTVLKLDSDERYFIYVNEEPCTTVKCEIRDIYATYNYVFLDREGGEFKELIDDQMTFYFALYDNYSYLYIEVDDGENTADLWNAYFNKNSFKTKIVKVSESFYKRPNYKTVTMRNGRTILKEVILKEGSNFTLPVDVNLTNFRGWKDSAGNIISKIENITNDVTIFAYISDNITYDESANTAVIEFNSMLPTSDNLKRSFTLTIKNAEIINYILNKNYQKIELNPLIFVMTNDAFFITPRSFNFTITITPDNDILGTVSGSILIAKSVQSKTQYSVPLTFSYSLNKNYVESSCELILTGEIEAKDIIDIVKEKIPDYSNSEAIVYLDVFNDSGISVCGAKVYD